MQVAYFVNVFNNIIGIFIPVFAAIIGTIWGLRRLFEAKRKFVDLLESNSFKSKTKMNEELLKNMQTTYAPIAFMKICGILFPLFLILSIIKNISNAFDAIALAGTVNFTLMAAGLSEALILYQASLIALIYTWFFYFFLKHTSRKIRIDIMTLFKTEVKDLNI